MTTRPRLTPATGGAEIQPGAPLLEPFILWDSRSWDGTTGEGSGGLPNEGTGGSQFDLDVVERVFSEYWVYYGKQGPGTGANYTPGPTWDELGGPPCDGPITMMVAIADFPRSRTGGVLSGEADGAVAAQLYLRYPTTLVHTLMYSGVFNNNDGDASGFFEMWTNGDSFNYPYALWNLASNPGDDLTINLRLLTFVMDVADGGASFWRGDVPVPPDIQFVPPTVPYAGTDELEVYDQFPISECDSGAAANAAIETTGTQLAYFGEHRSYGTITPGQPWNGAIGAAFFRGEPTDADRTYWADYFLTGYAPQPTAIGFQPNGNWTIRTDGTYVYHYIRIGTASPCSLIPLVGKPTPPTVDLFMIGGGGAGFDNDSANGLPAGGGAAGAVIQASGLVIPPLTTITCYIGPGGVRYTGSGRGAGDVGSPTIWDFGSNTPGGRLTAFGGTAGLGTGVGGSNSDWSGGSATGYAGGGGAGAGSNGQTPATTLVAGQGGTGVINDWLDGTPYTYGIGGNGGGRSGFGDPNLLSPTTQPFRTFSGDGGPAQLTPTVTDRAGSIGWLCIRYLRLD